MKTGAALVLRADARDLPLPTHSVDLIVTSPPYFALRSYTDGGEHYDGQIGAEATPQEYIAALVECTREWVRVLKPSGSIWVNLGDKYSDRGHGPSRGRGTGRGPQATHLRQTRGPLEKSLLLLPERYRIACIDEVGLVARAVVVWSKTNALPESVTDRVRRSHEDWVHLTARPKYFSNIDEIRQPHAPNYARKYPNGQGGRGGNRDRRDGGVVTQRTADRLNPLGALPGSVWEVATEPLDVPERLGVDHFAAFPMEWPRRIVRGWSPRDGVVLDPFGGTGTTALVAKALGRHGISVDRSADYCRLAAWRTTDPGQMAKAMRVEKPAVQLDGQADLLAELGEAS
jgi:DNA modification methylase